MYRLAIFEGGLFSYGNATPHLYKLQILKERLPDHYRIIDVRSGKVVTALLPMPPPKEIPLDLETVRTKLKRLAWQTHSKIYPSVQDFQKRMASAYISKRHAPSITGSLAEPMVEIIQVGLPLTTLKKWKLNNKKPRKGRNLTGFYCNQTRINLSK